MNLMDLEGKAEQSKHDFWLFLMEQSLHDTEIDVFAEYGQFCGQIDEMIVHARQAFAELDAVADEARVKMDVLVDEPDITSSLRSEHECDCAEECENCRRLREQSHQNGTNAPNEIGHNDDD